MGEAVGTMSPHSTQPATVHLELAPAKLTVSLRVTGVRPDGYHLIDAEMVSIDLVDALAFRDSDLVDLRVSLDKRFDIEGNPTADPVS